MSLFSRKKLSPGKKGDVVILKQTRPNECGGTDATQRTDATKVIASTEMTLFSATSALPEAERSRKSDEPLGYVSAFAAPGAGGTFLFLETAGSFSRRDARTAAWALVKADVFPDLVRFVNETALAKRNGYHSTTHGLPENFGGSVDVRYAGGERIDFSDNQTPILSREQGERIAALFTEAMRGEAVPLPDAAAMTEIRFTEERKGDGYTRATLTFAPDGTATNKKVSRYDDPTVYESEKPVDAETVSAIRKTVASCGLLAWVGLPDNPYGFDKEKTMTFVFPDGTEIAVGGNKLLPDPIRGGFFSIELEMTTKH